MLRKKGELNFIEEKNILQKKNNKDLAGSVKENVSFSSLKGQKSKDPNQECVTHKQILQMINCSPTHIFLFSVTDHLMKKICLFQVCQHGFCFDSPRDVSTFLNGL